MSAPAPLASASTSAPATRRYHAELEVAESIATLATHARALLAAMNDLVNVVVDKKLVGGVHDLLSAVGNHVEQLFLVGGCRDVNKDIQAAFQTTDLSTAAAFPAG